MAKQLSVNEWKYLFEKYEKYRSGELTKKCFLNEMMKIKNVKHISDDQWKRLVNKYKRYNLGMNIESMSGRSPKKGKGSGRPKKTKSNDEILDEFLNDLNKEDLIKIIKIISTDDEIKKIKKDKFKETVTKIKNSFPFKVSNKFIMSLLKIKKSTYYKKLKKLKMIKEKNLELENTVVQAFKETGGIFGRERLAAYISKNKQIKLNYRTLGRIMKKLGLVCRIRKAKRTKESKNVAVTFQNIASRDYDGIYNDIYATDVTYIPSPIDVDQNFVYMSAVIHHKTKKILGFNLSLYNDNSLVIDNIKKVNFPKNFVIHSDHGSQYSSKEYLQLIERLNGKVSMSRIGNSLDNREIEYFFSVLKTEMFENFEKSVKKMTLKELERHLNKFIDWYNNERMLKKFNYKTPHELWVEFCKK
ncbi:IS3 family transposase [Mycoplasmopsis bovis]|uniref:IS3 family transposase n=1 Tax=Mycoplasmopsis bovis TaxID=28903 RepID=UPI00279C42C2|nr:IS3 family transposase [Mycoplasmopsis bovis]WHO18548.1 IS3 family transposase [Mycoplasmopsis bovis]WHO18815.1 IS3 family transposase [Mycoplasmopsis bovis]